MSTSDEAAQPAAGNGLLAGKKGLIVGVANKRSIAWGIAQEAHRQGAELGFTFLGEALEKRVRPLADSIGSTLVEPLDVGSDEQIDAVFEKIRQQWGELDFVVHSVAYADRGDLEGRAVDTSRAGFLTALEISAYSLVALTRAAEPLMKPGSSILTMTYEGSVKAAPNYNVMGMAKAALEAGVRYLAADLGPKGIRINGLSAGAVKTLAGSGVAGIRTLLKLYPERSPLRKNVSLEEIGGSAVYLLSDLAGAVTGEIHNVDSGFNITIM